jgi:hypothetical protein
MRKLSFVIASLSLLFSVGLNAQQPNIEGTVASPNGGQEEGLVEYIEHTKVGIVPLLDGGIGARIVEYTDEDEGKQVLGNPLSNEITREVNCNCMKLVKFTKKDYLLSTNLYYDENKSSAECDFSDGKYTILILNQDTNETLYTMIVKLNKGKIKVKREFKSVITNSETPIKIKKSTPIYLYINFKEQQN